MVSVSDNPLNSRCWRDPISTTWWRSKRTESLSKRNASLVKAILPLRCNFFSWVTSLGLSHRVWRAKELKMWLFVYCYLPQLLSASKFRSRIFKQDICENTSLNVASWVTCLQLRSISSWSPWPKIYKYEWILYITFSKETCQAPRCKIRSRQVQQMQG